MTTLQKILRKNDLSPLNIFILTIRKQFWNDLDDTLKYPFRFFQMLLFCSGIFMMFFECNHSRPLFYLFLSFQHLTVNMFIIKFYRWLDSNRGPLAGETTTLPTESQLPSPSLSFHHVPLSCSYRRTYTTFIIQHVPSTF